MAEIISLLACKAVNYDATTDCEMLELAYLRSGNIDKPRHHKSFPYLLIAKGGEKTGNNHSFPIGHAWVRFALCGGADHQV